MVNPLQSNQARNNFSIMSFKSQVPASKKTFLNFELIETTARNQAESLLNSWFDGKNKNHHFEFFNPNRDDNNLGSCKFNLDSFKFNDFASTESGEGIINCYAQFFNLDYYDAAIAVAQQVGIVLENVVISSIELKKIVRKPKPKPVELIPFIIEYPNSEPPQLVGRVALYEYAPNLFVSRIESKGEKKEFRPQYWCEKTGYWVTALPTNQLRPLFNLKAIQSNTGLPVVFFEGEKDVINGVKHFPLDKYVLTTTMGGSNAQNKTDFSSLKDRDIIICSDNDEPGQKYAFDIEELAKKSGAKSVKILINPDNLAEKQSVADLGLLEFDLSKAAFIDADEEAKKQALEDEFYKDDCKQQLSQQILPYCDNIYVTSLVNQSKSFPDSVTIGNTEFKKPFFGPITLLEEHKRFHKTVVYLLDTSINNNLTWQYSRLQKNVKATKEQYICIDGQEAVRIESYIDAISYLFKNGYFQVSVSSIRFLLKTFSVDSSWTIFNNPLDIKQKITLNDLATILNDYKHKLPTTTIHNYLFQLRVNLIQESEVEELLFKTIQKEIAAMDIFKKGCYIVDAALGLGKTAIASDIINRVKQNDPNHQLILPTYRISLSKDSVNRHGCESYNNTSELSDENAKFLSIVVNSLLTQYDLDDPLTEELENNSYSVILDEIDFILKQVTSKLITQSPKLYKILVHLIQNARCVYVFQYKISNETKHFLKKHCGLDIIYDACSTDKPKINQELNYFPNKEAIKERIQLDVTQNKRPFVTCGSKKEAKEIAKLIKKTRPSYKVLLIYSINANDPDQRAFIEDANGQAVNYDAIIATSVLESGFNISVQHFDCNYGVYDINKGNSCTPQAACQMLFRNRCAKYYAFYSNNNIMNLPTDLKTVTTEVYDEQIKADKKFSKYTFYKDSEQNELSEYGEFVAMNIVLGNKEHNDPLRYILDYMQCLGFNIKLRNEEVTPEFKTLLNELEIEVKKDDLANIVTADDISSDQNTMIEIKIKAHKAMEFEHHQHDRYEVNTLFDIKVDEVPEEVAKERIKQLKNGYKSAVNNHYLMELQKTEIQNVEAYYYNKNKYITKDITNPKLYVSAKRELLIAINYAIQDGFSAVNLAAQITTDFIENGKITVIGGNAIGLKITKGKISPQVLNGFIKSKLGLKLFSVKSGEGRTYFIEDESKALMESVLDLHRYNEKYNHWEAIAEQGKQYNVT